MTEQVIITQALKPRLQRLKADLEPYRGKTVGSLRIDMGEVQAILQTLDRLAALFAPQSITPPEGEEK